MQNQRSTSKCLCHLKEEGRKKNNITCPPAVFPVVNIGEIGKGFKEKVAFELDLEGRLDELTSEGIIGADMAERNLRVCVVNSDH